MLLDTSKLRLVQRIMLNDCLQGPRLRQSRFSCNQSDWKDRIDDISRDTNSRGDWPGWPDPELLRLAAIGQNRHSSCTFAVIPTLATTSGVGRYLYGQGSSADYTVDRRVSNMDLANGGSREIRKKLISLSVYITQNDFFWHIPSGRH